MKKLYFILCRVVLCLFILAFSFVSLYCVRFSVYLRDIEYVTALIRSNDSMITHILFLTLVVLLFVLISFLLRRATENLQTYIVRAALFLSMVLSFSFCAIWILQGNFYPINDCNAVLRCVERMRAGDYSDLLPSGYLGTCVHQLGLVSIVRFLYLLSGTEKEYVYEISTDYVIFQWVNCICIPIIVIFGQKIIDLLVEEDKVWVKNSIKIAYSLLILGALPLFFYSPYVYGEVISATMGLIFIWASCKLFVSKKKIYYAVLLTSGIIGYFARGNFLIVVLAFIAVSIMQSIKDKRIWYVCGAIGLLLTVLGASKINLKYYESISGIEINQGVPVQCFIAMGLDESNNEGPGWYNGRNVETYANSGYDRELAKEAANKYIHDRITMFKNGAGTSAYVFYKEKMFTQWADPTMNCFIETKVHIPDAPAWIANTTNPDGKNASLARKFMDEYQIYLLLGILLFAFGILLRSDIQAYSLFIPIVLIGGFLFSLLWEAMGRYIFPYFVYMLPVAPIGISIICQKGFEKYKKVMSKRIKDEH